MTLSGRSLLATKILLGAIAWVGVASAASNVPSGADPMLQRLTTVDDRVGARLRVKELSALGLDALSYKWLETQVARHTEWGEDLRAFTLEKAASKIDRLEEGAMQAELDRADAAMLSKRFGEAVQRYRSVLGGSSSAEIGTSTTHYIRLALSRALYAQKKFEDAYVEARKIPPNFSRYRHVLFFRMWSAFRAGRVEIALGELANQRSLYFGPYMEPESYLLMTYLLKRLCRESEAAEVISQVEGFLSDLRSGKIKYQDWARLEVGTSTYLNLIQVPEPEGIDPRKSVQRDREKALITKLLMASFEHKKKQWLEELPRVIAYSRLATTPGMGGALKPIEKIEGREKLLSQGYEIWPNEDGEHWLDELGSQRYLGDSQCAAR